MSGFLGKSVDMIVDKMDIDQVVRKIDVDELVRALYRLLPRYRHFARVERQVFEAGAKTEILTISDNEIPYFRKHYATPEQRFHSLPPGIYRDRAAPADAGAAHRSRALSRTFRRRRRSSRAWPRVACRSRGS